MPTSFAAGGQPVFRFAPSPNGRLHLGHALSALSNERFARHWGGRLLLRIEDIDLGRCRPAFEDGIVDDLAWLGLAFDGAIRRQSEHFETYATALAGLARRKLVYPCFCSRRQVEETVAQAQARAGRPAARDPDGAPLYPGTCRTLSPDQATAKIAAAAPHLWRLDTAAALAEVGETLSYALFDEAGGITRVAVDPARWGDVVLARRDVPTSYHLSVVVDDALQGVSHVVRGRDLEAATDIHLLLQRLLDLPSPAYHFHRLLSDATGRKLAKSRDSESLAALRASGVSAAVIRADLGFDP